MTEEKQNDEVFQFRLPHELLEAIHNLAGKMDVSLAWLTREALRKMIQENANND